MIASLRADDPSTSVRVRVASTVSPTTAYDDSDADFTIQEAGAVSLTLTAPAGSTRWPVSSTQQIRWTTVGTITHVNLYYIIQSLTRTITTSLVNTGRYTWTTPPTATTAARVRVESEISPTIIYDVSAPFTLYETGEFFLYLPLTMRTEPKTEPPPTGLLQPGDLVYQGAFRLPGGDTPPETFAYGGNAMTFNPNGDPGSTDGFPGSLFIMGHDRLAYGELPNGSQVAELSIPVPVVSTDLSQLNQARFLQDFHDVTAGHFTEFEEIPRVGMEYLDTLATGPKIHLAWGQHMPPDQPPPTHAWFDPDLSAPNFQGTWFIGNQSFDSVNGYMFEIPTAWADQHAAGRYLATGRFRDGGWSGMGPALFAYRPWVDENGTPASSGTRLQETVLLLYESSRNTENIERCLNGYQNPDEWEGGAWLTTSSGKTAVLFAGTKSNGVKYWYGWVNPAGPQYPCVDTSHIDDFLVCRMADGTSCPQEDFAGCDGHNDYRGWWTTRFDAQFILYDPAQLAQAAAGAIQSWQPQPYNFLDIDEHLYLTAGVEPDMLGTGDQRRNRIGAVAYDRGHDLLYVLELFADGARPVVHVWRAQ